MRLTPAQLGVALICGDIVPGSRGSRNETLAQRIKSGHDLLVSVSGKDFGYDLVAWHAYLKESRDGGYTWGRNIVLPRVMKAALASKGWRDAILEVQSGTSCNKNAS
jgi:hypothetical protein